MRCGLGHVHLRAEWVYQLPSRERRVFYMPGWPVQHYRRRLRPVQPELLLLCRLVQLLQLLPCGLLPERAHDVPVQRWVVVVTGRVELHSVWCGHCLIHRRRVNRRNVRAVQRWLVVIAGRGELHPLRGWLVVVRHRCHKRCDVSSV